MPGVHQYAIGQRAWLGTVGLVRLIEQGTQLRLGIQQQPVKVSGQRLATRFQKRNGGFDDGAVLKAKHCRLQSRRLAMNVCLNHSTFHAR